MAWYTTNVTERERPKNRLLRAFILYAALIDWMDDCQIVITASACRGDDKQRAVWQRNYNASCWKATLIERYIKSKLGELE